ncbi:hypothetical protein RAB80_010445 [Fusarium oxysporum f. sp. vasinfectum]|uniref:Uncharacterized protein n=1 Tax=Fusarium oxysporum f. sp. vasinfectum 25433 TaxID=1089449 RepID=X0LJ50_FUSOX|nr:hypothetical protein FOTG_11165 [Fusarium oxysporum f. sp. vasinfectum 25433]KAK2672902.1 hypothetical protein RAB80_010445 [Fusarium oxysporum f. sp. vasinfectum]KAK2690575.1 hypothetical protein QWA68_010212 [Fusarium oxysporum]KAK2929317.1 hypothetical protein FoTM2_009656 [Fusarium oxysporum f. sp. vasinfectum]
MCQIVEENGNKPQKQSQNCCMQSSATRSSQGPADQPQYHVETFPIPAPQSEYDFDHRRTITIESQQRLWPQDIWVHSPHGRQLYQPVLMFETTAPEDKTETNGHSSKSG